MRKNIIKYQFISCQKQQLILQAPPLRTNCEQSSPYQNLYLISTPHPMVTSASEQSTIPHTLGSWSVSLAAFTSGGGGLMKCQEIYRHYDNSIEIPANERGDPRSA